MKKFLVMSCLAIAMAFGISSCGDEGIRLPEARIEGTAHPYLKASNGILHIDEARPTINITFKKTRPFKGKFLELVGPYGTGGNPSLALLDEYGDLIGGGEMHMQDPHDLGKLKRMLLAPGSNEMTIKFVTNELTSDERSNIAKKAKKMAFRCDIIGAKGAKRPMGRRF